MAFLIRNIPPYAYAGYVFQATTVDVPGVQTPQATTLRLVCLSYTQGVDPYRGSGGGGGTLGGVGSSSSGAAGAAGAPEGLDDLSLSSVSSTLASFFLFLAILRCVATLFGSRACALFRGNLRLRTGRIQRAVARLMTVEVRCRSENGLFACT